MTILEAISRIDGLKHNTYTNEEKVAWLSRLDSMVKRLIIDTHEDGESVCFYGYNKDSFPETVLLVPEPFDEMYIRWLEAQIDYANGEYGKYNNSIAMYQASWDGYRNWYNSQHLPKGSNFKYF